MSGTYPMLYCEGYPFSVLPTRAWDTIAGPAVYLFCRRELDGRRILYIGECDDLSARIGPAHEKWADALRLGMNEVHVHLLARTRPARLAIETLLRRRYPTPLNEQSPVLQGLGLLGALPPAPTTVIGVLAEALAPPHPASSVLAPFGLAPPANAMLGRQESPFNALLAAWRKP